MDPALVVDIGRQALTVVILVAGPLLIAGLTVGLMVGVFQAVTQIHEMTLTFIPKILAIVCMLFFMMTWMILKLVNFVVNLFNSIPTLID